MAAKCKRFIVLVFSDRENDGFDEYTLPSLVALMDSARPDEREFCHTGVTGYFLTSRSAMNRVRMAVELAEGIRTSDRHFGAVGIGLAEGSLLGEFSFFGRLKRLLPYGAVVEEAMRSAQLPDAYRDSLQRLDELQRSG